jgi:hypothetical protein
VYRKHIKKLSILLFCLLNSIQVAGVVSTELRAQNYVLDAVFTVTPPVIDGIVEEALWMRANLIKGFTQTAPYLGEPSAELTGVRILYDAEAIYFLVICTDRHPESIVANIMTRDGHLNDDDNIEIYIDSMHDHRTTFSFQTNPLGARRDVIISNNGATRREEWDGIWEAAARVTAQGWVAEVAIPFETLRFGSADVQTWGLQIGRVIRRLGEESVWVPLPPAQRQGGSNKAALYGHLNNIGGLAGKRNLQFYPYATAGATRTFGPKQTERVNELGGDIKYGLTSQLTADFTFNTDFAQIESDDEQVNLTRFSLFFREKRDFFNESAGLFELGSSGSSRRPDLKMFYSRRIGLESGKPVDILGGQRISGRIGNYSVGVMNILTDDAKLDDSTHLPGTLFSVVRVRRDILTRSGIGFMFLNKQVGTDSDRYYRGAAGDVQLILGDSFEIAGSLMKSFAPESKDHTWAGSAEAEWLGDGYGASLATLHVGSNFNPEMGFVRRSNIWVHEGRAGADPRLNWGMLRSIGGNVGYTYTSDQYGNLLSRRLRYGLEVTTQREDGLEISRSQSFEHLVDQDDLLDGRVFLDAGDYRFNSWSIEADTDAGRPYSMSVEYTWGDFWHGRQKSWAVENRVNALGRLIIDLRYERDELDFSVVSAKERTNLVSSRITYTFHPDLSTKLFTQFNDSDDRLLFNFLVRWTFSPGSDLYVVYNETYESFADADPLYRDDRWKIKSRTAAAKLVYKF